MKNHVRSYTRILLPAMILITIGALLTACGFSNQNNGSGGGGSSDVGPQAITNGQTLGTATTHWVAQSGCTVGGAYNPEVELTVGDSGFKTQLTYCGQLFTCTGNWIPTSNGATAMMSNPQCTGASSCTSSPDIYISSLPNIAGSTSSGGFASGVDASVEGTGSSNNMCVWNLEQGSL